MSKPEIFNALRGYNPKIFFSDGIAGLLVVVVALPLAIAFAIASGVGPERGLYTAIIGGGLISLLGGSRHQIGGPSGTFAIFILAIMLQFGYSGLVVITFLAGCILIALGVFRLGGLVRFMPYTIVTGFTAGAAVLILSTQLGDFMGLETGTLGARFIDKIAGIYGARSTLNPVALAVSASAVAIQLFWPKVTEKIPGALVAIIATTVAVRVFDLPVATIGSRFGSIPAALPSPSLPNLAVIFEDGILSSAISLAALISIESLLSAVVADGMTGFKHNSNAELIAHGAANIACSLFGGIPATAAVARTATNIRNGGHTPVAGIIAAVILALIMVFLAPYAEYIPIPTLASVLVVVAFRMSGIPAIRSLLRGQKSDICVLVVTFFVTVFGSMTSAIEIGLILAGFFFIQKMSRLSEFRALHNELEAANGTGFDDNTLTLRSIPRNVTVFEISGPLFFGSVQKFEQILSRSRQHYRVLVLRMRDTIYLDAGGIAILSQLNVDCLKKGITLLISDIHTQPYMLMAKSGLDTAIGRDNIYGNLDDALFRAAEIVGVEYEKAVFKPTVAREREKNGSETKTDPTGGPR